MHKIVVGLYSVYIETNINSQGRVDVLKTDTFSSYDDLIHRVVVGVKANRNGVCVKMKYDATS